MEFLGQMKLFAGCCQGTLGYTRAMNMGLPGLALCRDIGCVGLDAGGRIAVCLSGVT